MEHLSNVTPREVYASIVRRLQPALAVLESPLTTQPIHIAKVTIQPVVPAPLSARDRAQLKNTFASMHAQESFQTAAISNRIGARKPLVVVVAAVLRLRRRASLSELSPTT